MKELKLKCGKVALVDEEDFDILSKHTWRSYFDGWNLYVRRSTTIDKKSVTILMHRQVLNVQDRSVYVDHIDHDGLNNQKINLRRCTPSENKKNTKGRGSSNFLGVSLKTTKNKYTKKDGVTSVYINKRWEARIQHLGKQISIGLFHNETDAARAYDEKAKILHGQFANLNFK